MEPLWNDRLWRETDIRWRQLKTDIQRRTPLIASEALLSCNASGLKNA
jgi:hypothetical protein